MLWSATFFVSDRGLDASAAASFGALFILGLTAGRFLSGLFADRVGDRALIRGGFLLGAAGAALIGIQMAAAYTGTTIMPPLFGILSGRVGLRLLPFYLLALALLGLVMTERLNRLTHRRS